MNVGTDEFRGRNLSIDLIKIIAMLGVVCLHSTHSYINTAIGMVMYSTAVISIPLFFIVSGYLLIGKECIDYQYVIKKMGGGNKICFYSCLIYLGCLWV